MNSLHQISEALGTNASWLLAGSENTREATGPHRLRAATEEPVKLLMIEASPGLTNVRLR